MKTFFATIVIALSSLTATAEIASPTDKLYLTCQNEKSFGPKYEFFTNSTAPFGSDLRVVVTSGTGEFARVSEAIAQIRMLTWITEEITFTLTGREHVIVTSNSESPSYASTSVGGHLGLGLRCEFPQ